MQALPSALDGPQRIDRDCPEPVSEGSDDRPGVQHGTGNKVRSGPIAEVQQPAKVIGPDRIRSLHLQPRDRAVRSLDDGVHFHAVASSIVEEADIYVSVWHEPSELTDHEVLEVRARELIAPRETRCTSTSQIGGEARVNEHQLSRPYRTVGRGARPGRDSLHEEHLLEERHVPLHRLRCDSQLRRISVSNEDLAGTRGEQPKEPHQLLTSFDLAELGHIAVDEIFDVRREEPRPTATVSLKRLREPAALDPIEVLVAFTTP